MIQVLFAGHQRDSCRLRELYYDSEQRSSQDFLLCDGNSPIVILLVVFQCVVVVVESDSGGMRGGRYVLGGTGGWSSSIGGVDDELWVSEIINEGEFGGGLVVAVHLGTG